VDERGRGRLNVSKRNHDWAAPLESLSKNVENADPLLIGVRPGDNINYSIIFRIILSCDIGSIFVQHFPQEKLITISLSDFGLGIPAKVRKALPELSDDAAIIKAVADGFTTKSKPGNKGVGLDYLLKTVVGRNGGQVTIYSCSSIVRFERRKNVIKPVALADVGFCPGTTIDIRTDTIEQLPDEREGLQW
jgi:hypothetical protein